MDWHILSTQKELEEPLKSMVDKISSFPIDKGQKIKEERDFIRFFCMLDPNWSIDTNKIIFLAKEAYKKHSTFHSLQQQISQQYNENIGIVTFWKNLCTKTDNISIELQVSETQENTHPVHLEVYSPAQDLISFDLKQPDEEIDTLETCEFEVEHKKGDLAHTLRNVLTDRDRWKRYAHASWNWTKKQADTGHKWLQKRDYFRPEIKKTSHYLWQKYRKGQNWVLHEQEIFIPIKRDKNKKGYLALLTHKYIKIKLKVDKNRLQSLYNSNPSELMRVLKGILSSSKLGEEERSSLTQLKDSILIREKMLLQQETLLDIINYGWVKYQRILNLLSSISNKRKINKKVREYLHLQIHPLLTNHSGEFRKNVEKKHNLLSLNQLIATYTLKRLSTLEHYPELNIIHKVKRIISQYQKNPDQLTPIINTYLGTTGEVNIRKKLPEILLTNETNHYIFEKIADERYLQDALKTLQQLQRKPSYRKVSSSLFQLITTFIESNDKFSYPDFRTSLNFVPVPLQRKILSLVKKELQEKLNIRINTILGQEGRYIKRYDDLLKELENIQYQDAGVYVYKLPPEDLAKRIHSISYDENKIDKILHHILGDLQLPESLLFLLKKAKSAKEKTQEKNIPNCLRVLAKIEGILARNETIQMKKVLVSLFQQHGNIDFTISDKEINGYKIAREISIYYNNPQRTTFELSLPINEEIKQKLMFLINTHRKEQLKKIGN